MQKVLYIFAMISLMFGQTGSAEGLAPTTVIKSPGEYNMAWGPYADQIFWDYKIGEKLKFHVVEALVDEIDTILNIARERGMNVLHVDKEVIFFSEKSLVKENLVLVTK